MLFAKHTALHNNIIRLHKPTAQLSDDRKHMHTNSVGMQICTKGIHIGWSFVKKSSKRISVPKKTKMKPRKSFFVIWSLFDKLDCALFV